MRKSTLLIRALLLAAVLSASALAIQDRDAAPVQGASADDDQDPGERIRAILPEATCLAPARLAKVGRSPRCVVSLDRPPTVLGADRSLAIVSLAHASTTGWRLPEATLAVGFAPLPAEAEAQAIVVDGPRREALVAVGSRLRRYATTTGRVLREDDGPGGMIDSLAWSRDGKRVLVAAAGDGQAHLLGSDARPLRTLTVEGQAVAVAMDPRGARAAVGTDVGSVALFELDQESLPRVLQPSLQPVAALGYAGGRLLLAGTDGTLRVVDASGGEQTARVEVGSPFVDLAVAPDGRLVASAARDRVIRIHALPSGEVLERLTWHEAGVAGLAWGAGPTLVSIDSDGELAVWDVEGAGR